MTVIVLENAPYRLCGRLAVYMVEIRAGVYVGDLSRRVRELLWQNVFDGLEGGDACMVWATCTESGYDVQTLGTNRRVPVDLDGFKLMSFLPQDKERVPF